MKIQFTLNTDQDRSQKFLSWFRMFAMQLLMAEDETIVDAKVDGEDFPYIYKMYEHV